MIFILFIGIVFLTFPVFSNSNVPNDFEETIEKVEEKSNMSREREDIKIKNSSAIVNTDNEKIEIDKELDGFEINIDSESSMKEFSVEISNSAIDEVYIYDDAIIGADEEEEFKEVTEFFDGGFRKSFVIETIDSPEEYVCDFTIPSGYHFQFATDPFGEKDGSIELVDNYNNPVMALMLPWAKDSKGKDVQTEYIIINETIIQKVYHKNAQYSYPIIADPTTQYNNWFKGTTWTKKSGGYSLSVKPSKSLITSMNAKKGCMIASVTNTSWNTLYNQHKNSKYWKNTQGMKDQYKCHAFNAQNKSVWNLDTWRPNVGYTKTVLTLCNP